MRSPRDDAILTALIDGGERAFRHGQHAPAPRIAGVDSGKAAPLL